MTHDALIRTILVLVQAPLLGGIAGSLWEDRQRHRGLLVAALLAALTNVLVITFI